jgi:TolB-like protein/class 3 adenylate cyclase
MTETRKLAAILVSDIVGYSRLAGADEDRILARLRTLRSDMIDPTIAVHHGRIVKRTGDGSIVEFRSVVDAVNCAIEVQRAMVERNAEVAPDKRIEFRIGIHLGDVVEESDGDLMGDGVNIAARLQSVAKPGAICLSEQAYWQVKGRLDLAVTDLGNTALKNIAEPVHTYSVEVGKPSPAKPIRRAASGRWRSLLVPLAIAFAALIAIASGAWFLVGPNRIASIISKAPAPPTHLSIVVLPFANLSGDPAQDYFADGITENLTTELSRMLDSFVIARNTAFAYKGKPIDAKEIGKELGVRYVLEGSVQHDQNRVRVNAQLIDAESGAHLWAERFEEEVADLFKLQDQVVARLANTLGYELVKAEAAKDARSTNPDANDLVMRGRALIWSREQAHQPSKDKTNVARALFEQALAIDPNNAAAITGVASTYFFDYQLGWGNSETDYDAKILGQLDRAIVLAPDYGQPYQVKSLYLAFSHRWDEAVRAADAGLAVNPNNPYLHADRATAEIHLGRFDEAKSDVQQAIRLSPQDPWTTWFHRMLGDVEFVSGHLEAAVVEYRKALDAGDHSWFVYAELAASYALLGRMDEAKRFVAETLRVNPSLTIKWYREHTSVIPGRVEGLRKAGFAEE